MEPICSAKSYQPADDLCVVTTYFNPCNYQSILDNYQRFQDSMAKSGIAFYTVECAFNNAPFQLPPATNVFQLRSNSILWQKERLINVAIARLKNSFKKIAWIDADVFFVNPNWAVDASSILEEYPLVQLFKRGIALPRGAEYYSGVGTNKSGAAYVCGMDKSVLSKGRYRLHGHTGYAWAARSEMLEDGLFDAHLLGASDHLLFHAMFGDLGSMCIDHIFHSDVSTRKYFMKWAERFYSLSRGRVSYLPEIILHRWHGEAKNRNYTQRDERLSRFGVDPDVDLYINDDGCWEWATDRPQLHALVSRYFQERRDDEIDARLQQSEGDE